ncbi:MAG: GFA family protein [Mariprofundus sp.]|nr:GFA family protein [Mariprofundus sp.]
MITGSCLCGKIRYEIHGEMGSITHCHCPSCRKAHAAAFSSAAAVQLEDLIFTAGEALLKSFESSAGKRRYFCSNCGSQIYAKREDQNHYIFRMGTIDGDPDARPARHIFTRYKALWYNIHDDLPEYFEWPTQEQPDPPMASAEYQHLYEMMNETLHLAARKYASTSLLLLMLDMREEQTDFQRLAREINHEIKLNVRDSDMIERLAPCRFAVLLPYTDVKASMILAERIRNTIKAVTRNYCAVASIGAGTLKCDQLDADNMIANIDELITMAKKSCGAAKEAGGDKAIHHDLLNTGDTE